MIHPRRCSTMMSGELKSLLETMPVLSQNNCGALNASEAEIKIGGKAARQEITRRTAQPQSTIRRMNKTRQQQCPAIFVVTHE